jgi:TetR/AcrR family transcriptional regulator
MKESKTKETIKAAAKNLFFKKGNIHATTQDIADEAGVNRALIHYYFSSREQLFEVILNDAYQNITKRLHKAISSDSSFKEKIENFVSSYIDEAIEFPFMESFIASEFNRYSDLHFSLISNETTNSVMEGFFAELQVEMKKGTIPSMPPDQFLINITSMCSFPLITRPLIQRTFNMDDKAYLEFIKNRKVEILKMIFK